MTANLVLTTRSVTALGPRSCNPTFNRTDTQEPLCTVAEWAGFVRLADRPCGSFARGELALGCQPCAEGAKMVLFVTGLCSFHCFYCPVSDEKMYKDVVFADEKRVTSDEDVLEEARAVRAKGVGIP